MHFTLGCQPKYADLRLSKFFSLLSYTGVRAAAQSEVQPGRAAGCAGEGYCRCYTWAEGHTGQPTAGSLTHSKHQTWHECESSLNWWGLNNLLLSSPQTKLAGEAQAKYERELMLHAADVEALQELKKRFQMEASKKRELEEQINKTSSILQEKTAALNSLERQLKVGHLTWEGRNEATSLRQQSFPNTLYRFSRNIQKRTSTEWNACEM